MFNHYLVRGDTKLRLGYTTGTAATLATKAALTELLTGETVSCVCLMTPKGLEVCVEPVRLEGSTISYGVIKDGGDDIDATDGALIVASVRRIHEGIVIDGGIGVGRVTKPGLEQAIGQAAINQTPRRMIKEVVLEMTGGQGGIEVIISVPEGETIAQRTFNERLGIVGGISIIGTSGIVEPRSNQALIETIKLDLSVQRSSGQTVVILTPGNMGEATVLGLPETDLSVISYSNFLGDTLDMVTELGFDQVFIVGHLGKLSKVAAGIMNTHSRNADGRREVMVTHSALQGVGLEKLNRMMNAVTTDAMLEEIKDEPNKVAILQSILDAAKEHITRRLPHTKCHILIYSSAGFIHTEHFFTHWRLYERKTNRR